jgi:hypothetical protein
VKLLKCSSSVFHCYSFFYTVLFFTASGRRESRGAPLETTHMTSVVEKLSLDYLVDEKRRSMYSDYGGYSDDRGGGSRPPNIMDIRKQILGQIGAWLLSLTR